MWRRVCLRQKARYCKIYEEKKTSSRKRPDSDNCLKMLSHLKKYPTFFISTCLKGSKSPEFKFQSGWTWFLCIQGIQCSKKLHITQTRPSECMCMYNKNKFVFGDTLLHICLFISQLRYSWHCAFLSLNTEENMREDPRENTRENTKDNTKENTRDNFRDNTREIIIENTKHRCIKPWFLVLSREIGWFISNCSFLWHKPLPAIVLRYGSVSSRLQEKVQQQN